MVPSQVGGISPCGPIHTLNDGQRTARPIKSGPAIGRWLHAEALGKLPRQIDCSPQNAQIMTARNLDSTKLLQMRRQPLCVEQDELAGAQMFHERHERNLGRVRHAMKH